MPFGTEIGIGAFPKGVVGGMDTVNACNKDVQDEKYKKDCLTITRATRPVTPRAMGGNKRFSKTPISERPRRTKKEKRDGVSSAADEHHEAAD